MESVKANVTLTNEKEKVERHLNHLNEVLKVIDQQKETYENVLKEYNELSNKISEYSKSLKVKINAPLGKKAFLPCSLSRTNEYTVFLGDRHLVKRSAHDTIEYINRRKAQITQQVKLLEQQKEETERKIKMTTELFSGLRGDEVEIIEPYDEKQPKSHARKRLEQQQKVSQQDFKDIMSRLDDLEVEEKKELEEDLIEPVPFPSKHKEGQDSESSSDEEHEDDETSQNGHAGYPDEEFDHEQYTEEEMRALEPPKGVPKEDFDKLLKYLNQMDLEDEEETDSDELSDINEGKEDSDEEIGRIVEEDEQPEIVKIIDEENITKENEGEDEGNDKKENVDESDLKDTQKHSRDDEPKTKRGVRFNAEELGPTGGQQPEPEVKSILRNRDEKPRVDRQYAEWMNKRFEKKIEPESKNVFKGSIVEKDPLLTLNRASETLNLTSEQKPQKLSKFKQNRLKK
ncbi:unnamed protein product [Bursaphelenchus xylophilus]|uniref:(pine wood nematode) hypothetical protein n=1 Tax=Bursaphelenchus xylophilus TaxID=6326 RepID=A0A1I7RLJ3_BURXY|nr:unnamed protein product [Bursaphelenchus xylophilus]CAG9082923.1 unnamed protein product [Bursaphelenchus xylophilus]